MKVALVNPPWHFEGSIYFGCTDQHLPLEFGFARTLLLARGHEVLLLDAGLEHLALPEIRDRVAAFGPDLTVITTAPTYLFWRCPPPELRVPLEATQSLAACGGRLVAVGPHASTTPRTLMRKLPVDAAVMGECEEVIVRLAEEPWDGIEGIARRTGDEVVIQGAPQAAHFQALPAIAWPDRLIGGHTHHHHRFDGGGSGLGAEVEASRGCPYNCTFCAKENFRDKYRRRPLATLLREIDQLLEQGVGYLYFVDEIFLHNQELLDALEARPVQFGVQTRIDLWKPETLDHLGRAGCVSVEAGIESISDLGRLLLHKECRLDADQLRERLVHARQVIPFVQATLLDSQVDDPAAVEAWRQSLLGEGIWANKPVPLFPYPGSPSYTELWGQPDEGAWERAVDHYLAQFEEFSDIQEARPMRLSELESRA